MSPAQKKLRDLRDRQSKERGKMAEYGMADSLSDEQRSELDTIEGGTADLERQLRGAQVAVDDEERATKTATAAEPDCRGTRARSRARENRRLVRLRCGRADRHNVHVVGRLTSS